MNTELRAYIDSAQAVSFDLFDTLVVHPYSRSVDLFYHLEQATQSIGFALARMEAETLAREKASKNGISEISIEEIYSEMHSSFQVMMEKEIQLTLLVYKANPEMIEVFQYVREQEKKIIVAANTYFPLNVVEQILINAGFSGYEKVFLVSSTLTIKTDKLVYREMASYLGMSLYDILHIGHHNYIDFEGAKMEGMSIFIDVPIQETFGSILNGAFFATLQRYRKKSIIPSLIAGLTVLSEAKNKSKDYWYCFGYKYAGILAYSYVQWLKESFDKEHINKAYFILKGGYAFQKVFHMIYPQYEVNLMQGSERMFLFASMENVEDLKLHINNCYTKNVSYAKFYTRLSIDNEKLKKEYEEVFSNQQSIISSEKKLNEVKKFFLQRFDLFLLQGKQERRDLVEYFEKIGLLDGKSAIVDLGWKGNMIKAIEKICRIEGKSSEIYGYCVGTHHFKTEKVRIHSFAINNGEPSEAKPYNALLNCDYVVPILDLLFSSPNPSVLKLKQQDGEFFPLYKDMCEEEKNRMNICNFVCEGVLNFVHDFVDITGNFSIETNAEMALIPMEYLSENVSAYDERKISSVFYFPVICDNEICFPISRNGIVNMGIINPWPGDKSAEAEVVTRMKKAADDLGIGCMMLWDFGNILDENQCKTEKFVDPKDVDFVLTTHYETHKTIDTFYYHTLWNPPEIPLNLDYYTKRVTNHYLMNDDYLIYDFGGMSNHLRSMLMNKPRTLEGASMLTASFPESAMLEPKLKDPKLFYCGMNWEKVVHNTNRHEGLFKLLDATGSVKFFGPECVAAWGGLRPWDGYKCYQYSIPFDGFSILKEINECGICLVLSSDIHRRAGAATNRTYEACAAGAVIISDNNMFMQHYFKEAALFINYNKNNPQDTFRQIMEKHQWIKEHPEEALNMARRAQEIFRKQFTLDKQLLNIVKNNPKRFQTIAKDLFAKDDTNTVLVTFIVNSQELEIAKRLITRVIKNAENQYYRSITIGVACDYSIYKKMESYCEVISARVKIIPMMLFDEKGSRSLTDGQAIRELQKRIPHDYFMNTYADEVWFYDHVTTLVRSIEDDSQAAGAYSGRLRKDVVGYSRTDFFQILDVNCIFNMKEPNWMPAPGQFLFSKECHQMLPDFLFDCLDGKEHYAYANLVWLKNKKSLAFSKRMTFVYEDNRTDSRCAILQNEMQIRFVQDLVRFDLPIGGLVENQSQTIPTVSADKNMFVEMLSIFPIKVWLKLRYYRFRLYKLDENSSKGKKFAAKYSAALKQYQDYWR